MLQTITIQYFRVDLGPILRRDYSKESNLEWIWNQKIDSDDNTPCVGNLLQDLNICFDNFHLVRYIFTSNV